MIIVCLGNKVSCCGNRDDIFNEDSHKPEDQWSCKRSPAILAK